MVAAENRGIRPEVVGRCSVARCLCIIECCTVVIKRVVLSLTVHYTSLSRQLCDTNHDLRPAIWCTLLGPRYQGRTK